jgi:predicted acyl esterase
MASNEWKHAASLKQVSNDTLTFYLDNKNDGLLNLKKPTQPGYANMELDFADRSSMNSYFYEFRIIWDSLFSGGGVMYKSKPFEKATEFTGSFTGNMKVTINKRDMDYSAVLFEQLPDGRYFYLSYFMGRASYATDNTKRQLLTPGKKTTLPFTNSYFTSRKIAKGSRLVLIVNVNKSQSEQINYGTGKDVSSETIHDAKEPLKIKWHNDGFIKIPISR